MHTCNFITFRFIYKTWIWGLGGTGQVQGGAAATDGAAGRASYVSIRPNTTNQNCVAVSGGNSTSTGKLASGATNGAASGTTIVSTASIHPLASLGILAQSAAGQTSGAGGTTGSGGNITPMTTGNIVSSGSGGGGVNAGTTTAAGGQILNSGFLGNAFSAAQPEVVADEMVMILPAISVIWICHL